MNIRCIGANILPFLSLAVFMILLVSIGVVSAAEHHVYNGESIQDAVDAANPEDTIIVHAGTYTENVNVNKQLNLIGIGMPVVDAGGSGVRLK